MFRNKSRTSIKSTLRVSQFQWAVHELFVASRREILASSCANKLHTQITSAITKQSKTLITLVLLFLVSSIFVSQSANDVSLSIRFAFSEIALPAIYVAFVGSACFALLLLVSMKILTLLTIKAKLPYTPFARGRFYEASLAIQGDATHFDVLSPIRGGKYFRSIGFTSYALIVSFFSVFLVLSLPLIGAFATLWEINQCSILTNSDIYLSKSLGLASLALLILPIVISILFFVPLKVSKDASAIRWTFLVHATRGKGLVHPQSKRWLKDPV